MAQGISINILANTRDAVRGVEGVADAVEDVQKNLHDLTKDRSTERLEDDFRDLQRQTDRTADTIKSKMADAYRDAARSSKRAANDMDDDLDKTGRAFGNLKDEARQSGTEAAASFSGEFTDGLDFAQEVAANLGPAGIAGGLLIGAIGAVATQAVQDWNDKIQGIKDATADMWADAAAEGQAFIDAEAIRAETARILWDKSYEEQFRAAESAGVSRAELATALATGEGEVFDRVHKAIMDAREEERQAAMDNLAASTDGNVALQDATAAVNSELARTVTVLNEKEAATKANKQTAADVAEAEKLQQQDLREQIQRTREASQTRYEQMAEQYRKPIKAKVELDDTAVRNYRPTITVDAVVRVPGTNLLRQ